MKLMLIKAKCYERVYVKKKSHGKSLSISRTISLVKMGAFSPASMTGSPVTGLVMIRALRGLFTLGLGVRTMLPFLISASSESPASMPSLRRIGPGRTTRPLVETFVCMTKLSYLSLYAWTKNVTHDEGFGAGIERSEIRGRRSTRRRQKAVHPREIRTNYLTG